MIVPDASSIVELLINGPMADTLRREMVESGESFAAPHLLDIEVLNAIRRLASGGRIDSHHIEQILVGLASLPVARYSHESLCERVWELRHNFTAYDAAYIALAEAMEAVLFTMDAKLAKGHRARVRVFRSSR